MTSAGATPVVVLARWKNRRAVAVSRRVDAYTSMPELVDRPVQVTQRPATFT
jgi:hypothetical protein